MIRVAREDGYTHLGIGPETHVPIRPEDIGMSQTTVRTRHLDAAKELVRDLAGADTRSRLDAPNARRLREWVAWYQG